MEQQRKLDGWEFNIELLQGIKDEYAQSLTGRDGKYSDWNDMLYYGLCTYDVDIVAKRFAESALQNQDAYHAKELAAFKDALMEAQNDAAVYKQWYREWRERCEAAERFSEADNWETYQEWQRLKNNMP